MPDVSLSSIEVILRAGQFSQFIALNEGLFFEAKNATPYDLETPGGRSELAKDVTAFANAEGGYLLIGLKTEPLAEERTDRVTTLDLCSQDGFDASKYAGIIKTHSYPRIDDLVVEWRQSTEDNETGLGVIYVPPQKEDRKWFLMSKVVAEAQPLGEIVVGICRRVGSDNVPLSAAEVYRAIQQGRTSAAERAVRIEEKVDVLLSRHAGSTPPVDNAALLEQRIARIIGNK